MIKGRDRNKTSKNYEFLNRIAPKGGLNFKDSYIRKGDGYETTIIVYEFPKRNGYFWLSNLMNIEGSIATIDLVNSNSDELIYNLNQSIAEHESRFLRDKKASDTKSAQFRYHELSSLYDDIYDGEVVKDAIVRIYLSAKTLPELEKRVVKTLTELESGGFKATLHLNLLEDDYKALGRPLSLQKTKATVPLFTKELTSSAIAGGIHTHYTKLHDVHGTYYGHCLFSDGSVVFDPFHNNHARKFYNSIVLGKMGSGKSTLLKKIAIGELAKGNKVRVFDASGEFFSMAEDFEGSYMSLDGTDSRINPLQIYSTSADPEKTKEENDFLSYQNHMAKLDVFFNYLLPDLSSSERAELTGFLHNYYLFRGIMTETNYTGVCDFEPARYGLLSDFTRYLTSFVTEDITSIKKERASELHLKINQVLLNYASVFDGVSSFDISEEQLVIFNMRGIASFPKNIHEAILFNVLNILWNEMLTNVHYGSPREVENEDQKYLLILDESHRLINSSSPESTLKFYEDFMRESRKYLAGIILSSHLLDDFGDDVGGKMNKLFQLTQYKFIFKQDISSKSTFEEVFSKELTASEIDLLPNFEVGECLLSISGFTNIAFKVSLGFSEEKEYLITGGR